MGWGNKKKEVVKVFEFFRHVKDRVRTKNLDVWTLTQYRFSRDTRRGREEKKRLAEILLWFEQSVLSTMVVFLLSRRVDGMTKDPLGLQSSLLIARLRIAVGVVVGVVFSEV